MADKYAESKESALRIIQTAYDAARNDFIDVLSNNIKITGLPDDVPEKYVKKALFEHGKLGVYKSPEMWLPVTESGIDLYGQPTTFLLVGANGATFNGTPEDVALIRLNPSAHPIIPYINMQASIIAQLTGSLMQNVISVQNSLIVECPDNESQLTLKNIMLQKAIGMPAIIARKGLADGIKTFPTSIPFIGDQLTQLMKEIRDDTLAHFGIQSANTNKRERVQSAEVNANMGEVVDSVYSMIDTFNADCELHGLTARMEFNGVSEEMFENTEESEEQPNEV